mgnify:CR=1 FL=1
MAKQKNTIGPKVIVDGETEFRNAIKNIENTMKTLNSEMKLVTSQFDKNDNSVEALTAKNTVLNKIIEEQKKKVEELRKGLESATKSYGENDEKTQEWQRNLNNATAKLNEMERQLRVNTETINKNKSATDNLGDEVENLGKEFKDAESKALTFGDVLKANIIGGVIVSGLRKVGGVLKESITDGIRLASDLAESQNVVDVTFGKNAKTIDDWSRTLDTAFGISELSAKQYVGTMGAMLKSMQLTDDQVLTMSKNLVQLAGDMASFYNIDVETAFNKLRSGISGETEPLKQLGINLSVANLEAFALAEGIEKSYSEMTQAEQATLRYNYLMKVTADAQGDFARTSDSLANQQRILDLQLENLQITMGKKVVPALTDGLSKINAKIDESGEALAEVAGGALKAVINGLLWMIDNSKFVVSGLAGITSGLVAFKTGTAIMSVAESAMNSFKKATDAAKVSQDALNASQAASPVGWMSAAIGLLVTGITALAISYKEAAESANKYNKEIEEINKNIDNNIQSREENIRSVEAEYGASQKLADELFNLAEKTNKTNEEKAQMVSLVEELNKAIPNLNLKIDAETGLLNKQRDEINKLIEANLKYYKVKAAQENLTRIAKDIYELEEVELKRLNQERETLINNLDALYKRVFDPTDRFSTQSKEFREAQKAVEDNYNAIIKLEEKINQLKEEWNKTNDFIKNNPIEFDVNTEKIEESTNKVKITLRDLTDVAKSELKNRQDALDKSYNDAIAKIRAEYGVYEKAEKSKTEILQEQLSEKRSLIENMLSLAQSAASQESEAFAKSSEQILEYARQLHNEKISMYMEEYLAQISSIDERVAAEIQGYKDEIAAIEKAQAEEDAAEKARQNRKKIDDLLEKVKNAKDDEERKKAKEALEEEITRQEREELKERRQNRIKELNQQIKDATEKAKEEKNNLLEVLKDRVENEKKIIEEQTNYNIRKIQEERKAKEEAETAKYNAAKKTLDDTEKALDDYLKKFKDKLSEETSSNIEAVAELAKLLNGTGIVVYSGLTGEGISTEGVSDNAPTRTSIQNSHYRLNHGLTASAKVEPFNSGLSLTGADTVSSQGYKDILNTASRAINDAIKAVTSPTIIVQNQQTVYPSTTNVVHGTAKISDADKADIVRMTVSELKQFNIILDGDKVGKFAVQAVSREMSIQ